MYSFSRYNFHVALADGDGLLVNTLHQSRIRLGAREFAAVCGDADPDTLDHRLESDLRELGMLVPSGTDERKAAVDLHQSERGGGRTLQLTIAKTRRRLRRLPAASCRVDARSR